MDIPTLDSLVLDALSASRRRVTLSVLLESERSVPVADLARTLAARETPTRGNGHPPDAEPVRASLIHDHLPKLTDADALVHDPDVGLVRARRDSPFRREWVRSLVETHPGPDYDGLVAALASERRQAVLYVLLAADRPLTMRDLSVAVAAHECGCAPGSVPAARRRVTLTALHHSHLPRLEEVGIVVRDGSDGTVRPGDTAWRSDGWVSASPVGEWAAPQ